MGSSCKKTRSSKVNLIIFLCVFFRIQNIEQKNEAELAEELKIDPQEVLFKEKILETKKNTKNVAFKKRNLGNKNLRVRNEENE